MYHVRINSINYAATIAAINHRAAARLAVCAAAVAGHTVTPGQPIIVNSGTSSMRLVLDSAGRLCATSSYTA